jgi:hypothetical protein
MLIPRHWTLYLGEGWPGVCSSPACLQTIWSLAGGGNHLPLKLLSDLQSLAIPVSLLMGELFQISWS